MTQLHQALAKGLSKSAATGLSLRWGVVNATHATPNSLDLYIDGATTLTTKVRYLSTYTPTVNDVVAVIMQTTLKGPDYLVIGKLA